MSMESLSGASNATIEGTPNLQSQLGGDQMIQIADRRQPQPASVLPNSTTTLQRGNDQTADCLAGQGSNINVDFELLWRLRKYLLLLGVLGVTVTYTAGLSPPGGFWTENKSGHLAGDPLLLVDFSQRYEVFFYFNATAFAASLVLIILLLSRQVASRHIWLRSMQATMILDLFSLMGAYAAGGCRAIRSSIYIWVLVLAVFIYIGIHILIFINVVPKWLKVAVQRKLHQILSKCHVREGQNTPSQSSHLEKEEIEEARKFILMLATFAATVTYQSGLSPPGGFWAFNEHGHRVATSLLRYHYLRRYNAFMVCNATAFVASLVSIILLLSTELSRHGIRSYALVVCVIVDLLALIGAYAAGCCREIAISFYVMSIVIVVFICIVLLVVIFLYKPVAGWLGKRNFLKDWLFSLPRDSRQQAAEHVSSDALVEEGASNTEHQSADNQQVANTKVQSSSTDDLKTTAAGLLVDCPFEQNPSSSDQSIATTDQVVEEGSSGVRHMLANGERDNAEQHAQTVYDYCSDANHNSHVCETRIAETDRNAQPFENGHASNDQGARHLENSNDDNDDNPGDNSHVFEIQIAETDRNAQPFENGHTSNDQGAQHLENSNDDDDGNPGDNSHVFEIQIAETNQNAQPFENGRASNDQGAQHLENSNDDDDGNLADNSHVCEIQIAETDQNAQPFENGRASNDQGAQHLEHSNVDKDGNPADVRLKKSRTYLLLLAILAVSVTYQAGLNPPGGFWTKNKDPHSAGDPILEDTYHARYIAFFYFNATAFVASLIIIIMLLSKRMSNKAIKRRALQMAMIVDLLVLMGAYVVGSCREASESVYISLLIYLVIAYVALHVLISIHVIPEGWKYKVQTKLKQFLSWCHVWAESPQSVNNQMGAINEKDLERRRNLLLMLSVLAATVTYQAGLNPPGSVWPDDKDSGGTPGNPVLHDNHPLRYNVFYYSNAASFVSSVAIIILLVNRESCEHGIKSYALRVCLVLGLLSLLIAYAAGSCRDVKSSIYLIIIAAAVLVCLMIQVYVLSSTQDALAGPLSQVQKWLQEWLLCAEEVRLLTTSEDLPASQSLEHHEDNTSRSVDPTYGKKETKRHKYLMLLAILAASITYQAGLNPPGGFWSDDSLGQAGNPVLRDIHPRRYNTFFCCNAISFMASIVVIMLLLSKSVRKETVPLAALHLIMILDLLALMAAYAAGSCRKVRTSIYVFVLVVGVVIYLVIVIILSSGVAKWLEGRRVSWLLCWTDPPHVSGANSQTHKVAHQV